MEAVSSWIQTIAVCLILVSIVINMIPSEQYKKYIRLFLGLVLVIMIARPLIQLSNDESLLNEYLNYYQKATESEIPNMEGIEKQREQAIWDVYEKQIKEELELSANKNGWHIVDIHFELEEKDSVTNIVQMQIDLNDQMDENQIITPVVITKGRKIYTKDEKLKQWKEEIEKQYEINSVYINWK